MIADFRRSHPRRTFVGDVLKQERDCHGRIYDVVVHEVEGAPEFITRKVNGKYYRYRYNEKTAVVALPRANRTWKREP